MKTLSLTIKHAALPVFFTAVFLSCGGGNGTDDLHRGAQKMHEKPGSTHEGTVAGHDHNDKNNDQDAHDDHSTEKQKAVVAADEKLGIQLAPEAQKTIGIALVPATRFGLVESGRFTIPLESVIFYENIAGVYVKRGNWFCMLPVRITGRGHDTVIIHSSGIKKRDFIVTGGAALLRLAYLEAFGASGHGHGH